MTSRDRFSRRWSATALALILVGCGHSEPTTAAPVATPTSLIAGLAAPISAVAGAAITPAPTFVVADASGNALAGVPVAVTVASGGGTITGAPTVSAAGATSVGVWTLGSSVGLNKLTVTSTSLPGSQLSISTTGVAGAAAQIALNTGANQQADVGGPLPVEPSVIVADANGNPVGGVSVVFAVASGGGSVTGGAQTTGANGIATVGNWTLGSAAGVDALTATSAGLRGSPVTISATALIDTGVLAPRPVQKTNAQLVYMHYMPWFNDTVTSGTGTWGSHWTMTNQNPSVILANGRRQIASFFYPMIGPYASSDSDVIDYHVLLMKYAGIDGLVVDWYGTHNVYDYPLVKRNTDEIFSRMAATGVQFGIVYEDATLPNVLSIAGIPFITAEQQDFAYLQSNYFKSSSYIKIGGQPLLLRFGASTFTQRPADWQQALSGLSPQPYLLSQAYQGDSTGSAGKGEFTWVYQTNLTALQGFYQSRAPTLATAFAAAYAGFQDFYTQGGEPQCCPWTIAYNGTATLQSTLSLAQSSGLKYVQLVTWNDYGEGTMFEPTLDFGFTFLQSVQQYTGVPYSITELQLIYKWFTLRKKYKGNTAMEQQLTQAYYDLVSLRVDKATAIINAIP